MDRGVLVDDGELVERLSGLRGDGERSTGGGNTDRLEMVAFLRLEALADRVTRLFGGGERSSEPIALRLTGEGEAEL